MIHFQGAPDFSPTRTAVPGPTGFPLKSFTPGSVATNGYSPFIRIAGSDVVKRQVKTGDIIIIPAGVPHGWTDIADHVDYLSLRPSDHILEAGYVHPSIKK